MQKPDVFLQEAIDRANSKHYTGYGSVTFSMFLQEAFNFFLEDVCLQVNIPIFLSALVILACVYAKFGYTVLLKVSIIFGTGFIIYLDIPQLVLLCWWWLLIYLSKNDFGKNTD